MKKLLFTFLGILILSLLKTPTLQGQSCAQRLAHDRAELIKLYNATNGAHWKNKWDLSKHVSTWSGVKLGDGCSVDEISLCSRGLSGSIPNFNLPKLKRLYLCYNQLSGSIPNFDLPKLKYLYLYNNQLSGSVPKFDHLPNLENLYFSGNQLSGSIPNFDFPKLWSLRLHDNQLSGSIPNFDFPKLWYLNLSNNQLSGSIPDFDLPKLELLYLSNNQLSGSIPDFDFPKLEKLYLNDNQLSGRVPNFDHLPTLGELKLKNNQLSGRVTNFDHLPSLRWLGLSNNQLSGSIPDFNLPSLVGLGLSNNQLSGSITDFNLPNLQRLYLHKNQLSGSIPDFDFPNLSRLELHENQLSGSIPNFDFPNLRRLYLHNNQLSGSIPNFDFPKLEELYLHNNQLTFQGIAPNLDFSNFSYSLQNPIPIYKSEGNKLYVKAGGGVENNTYTWYKNGAKYKTIVGDSLLITTEPGSYYCKVTNSVVTIPQKDNQNLVLQSEQIAAVNHIDYLELIKLYKATGGPYWKNKWDLSQPISTWYGVTLTADGYSVKKINLKSNGLSGRVPNLNLPYLEELRLDYNQLSGSIPNFDLPNLYWLNLDNNKKLSGSIPNFDLPKLEYLNLSHNKLSGSIPNFDFPNLNNLSLAYSQLSGPIPNFDHLPKLRVLSLGLNQLSGTIPDFDHLPNLIYLYLGYNQLSGAVPNFDFPNLGELNLSNNQLTFQGIAPNLDFSNFSYSPQNPIPIYKSEGNKLYVKAGGGVENNTYKWYKDGTEYKTIVGDSVLIVAEPDSYYCKVTNRVVNGLVLQSDQITIDNPDYFELIKLYNATGGAYWKNKWDLSQPISTWHGVTLADDGSRVERLDLSENSLVGSLPNLNFPKLEVLKLDGNELSGSIPNLNLPKLEWLYLNNNQLSGVVPNFDHSLFYLNITNNDFTFKGIEFDLNDSNQYMSFNPQRPIPIYKSEEGILYVQAGGGVHNNTYTWYRNDEEYKTIVGDSALVVTIPGIYYCKIVNNALSQGDYNGEFVLQSNSIFSVMSYVEAKRLTRGISPQESEIVLFPNPAKGSVSIQIQGAKGKQVDIQVIDRLGNPRLERSVKPLTNARISLDISSLSQGHYYVRIKVGGKAVATKPLIISH